MKEPTPDWLDAALRRGFGFTGFRLGQREVIEEVVAGRQVMAVMPTGAGKSLCYQLPAVLDQGTTLVVSPLIALMKDQVDSLNQRGIPATFINSQLSPAERARRVLETRQGGFRLVYVAPERFRDPSFLNAMRGATLNRMAVDEAHCVSQWGHDFRPDYRRLPEAANQLNIPQVCAFTATATPEVRQDMIALLELDDPRLYVYGFARENLVLRVVPVKRMRHKIDHLYQLARANPQGSGIIYAATRKHVEQVAGKLGDAGLSSIGIYHAGLPEEQRTTVQQRFMSGELRLMVATNAFGMGIDKPDIRYVIHYDMPGSMEAYYQEAGRAGRDGLASECAILFNYADVRIHEFFISLIGEEDGDGSAGPRLEPEQAARLRALEQAKLKRMVRYCYGDTCRHRLILRYFGERTDLSGNCGSCDICLQEEGEAAPPWIHLPEGAVHLSPGGRGSTAQRDGPALGPMTLPDAQQMILLQKVLSAFARNRGRLPVARVISLLRGTSKDLPQDLASSRSHGMLRGMPAAMIRAVVDQLAAQGALKAHRRHRLVLTAQGQELMMGRQEVEMRLPEALPARAAPQPDAPPQDLDPDLFQALKERRLEMAREAGVPAYVVAHNSMLQQMAALKPSSEEEMMHIKGMGSAKMERYGEAFLQVVRDYR